MAVTLFGGLTSCGDDFDPGGTAVKEMSGDWYVFLTVDGVDVFNLGYIKIRTYNTAANDDNLLWVDDEVGGYWMKGKIPADPANLTFGGTDIDNQSLDNNGNPYEITFNLTNGVILPDAATTSGGNVSDSIYFETEFSDDPGTIYVWSGYKRTGFDEDEH